MEALLVIVPFVASLLTFFSGFGLGTLLTPVFLLFFPIEMALGMTAVVHLTNNLFKISLLFKSIDRRVFLPFALFAIPGAFLGARSMTVLGGLDQWHFSDNWIVSPLAFIVGLLMITFTVLEFWPFWNRLVWKGIFFNLGGFMSGFFGGLSGHQGALRSLFLKKLEMNPMSFVATGTAVAVMVDVSRIPVYLNKYSNVEWDWPSIITACVSAMVGALLGKRLLKKVKWIQLQRIVGLFILLMGLALVSGKLS